MGWPPAQSVFVPGYRSNPQEVEPSPGAGMDACSGETAERVADLLMPEGAGYAAGSRRARAWGILAMRRHQPRQPPPSVPPHPRGFVAEEMIPKS